MEGLGLLVYLEGSKNSLSGKGQALRVLSPVADLTAQPFLLTWN